MQKQIYMTSKTWAQLESQAKRAGLSQSSYIAHLLDKVEAEKVAVTEKKSRKVREK